MPETKEDNAVRMQKSRRSQATIETKESNVIRIQKARAQATPKIKEDDAIRK